MRSDVAVPFNVGHGTCGKCPFLRDGTLPQGLDITPCPVTNWARVDLLEEEEEEEEAEEAEEEGEGEAAASAEEEAENSIIESE